MPMIVEVVWYTTQIKEHEDLNCDHLIEASVSGYCNPFAHVIALFVSFGLYCWQLFLYIYV